MLIQDNYIRNVHSIESVYDGDTITAIVDVGYDAKVEVKFRFLGINTAEMKGSKKGTERYVLARKAKAYVEEKLKSHKVRVHSEKFEEDSFGRYLGTMYYEEKGEWINLNEELIKIGLAEVYYKGASKNFDDNFNK
jgi:micrococcal nuclease